MMRRITLTTALRLLARGYLDPGTGGFIITSVLGFFTAIGYVLRTYWGRLRRLLSFGGGKAGGGASPAVAGAPAAEPEPTPSPVASSADNPTPMQR